MNVAVLGLGPMGQALAGALLDAKYRTTVWNRTAAKAGPLQARGAVAAGTPAAAVGAADLILVNVVDHDAVAAVLTAAGDAVAGKTVVGLSSDTPERARRTAELVAGLGGGYLDGAIMTPTATIGTPAASILFAGPRDRYDAGVQVFDALGTPTWLGPEYDRAAAFDMALLDLFWTSVAGFLHAVGIAKAHGIGPTALLPHATGIVDILTPIFTEIAERADTGHHDDPSASVSSVAASLHHLIATARSAGMDDAALQAFAGVVEKAIADGNGAKEISVLTP
ncbi:NAD(P)-dependent oxidoreductase [Mycolicibacterium cosmeticum]|uniref:NAD(P)-dependent oxidoreductase n=1 Tax=Mycolicibacterium cosmeticum TaxID=258533 RepID=UPI003204989A